MRRLRYRLRFALPTADGGDAVVEAVKWKEFVAFSPMSSAKR